MASIGDKNIIGSNIKRFRKARWLSQEKLAELADINEKLISFYENGTRNIPSRNLAPIAKALGVTVDELCGNTQEQTAADELFARISLAVLEVLKDYGYCQDFCANFLIRTCKDHDKLLR